MDTTIALKDLLSPVATILAAGGAAVGIILTLIANSRNLRKRQAFESYQDYMKDCLDDPKLASGDVTIPKNANSEWSDDFYKYQWLVGRFLGAAEEIRDSCSKIDWEGKGEEPGWNASIYGDARWHSKYFSSEHFEREEFNMCSPEIKEIILKVVTSDARKKMESWV